MFSKLLSGQLETESGKLKAESGNGKPKQEMVVKCTVLQLVY